MPAAQLQLQNTLLKLVEEVSGLRKEVGHVKELMEQRVSAFDDKFTQRVVHSDKRMDAMQGEIDKLANRQWKLATASSILSGSTVVALIKLAGIL